MECKKAERFEREGQREGEKRDRSICRPSPCQDSLCLHWCKITVHDIRMFLSASQWVGRQPSPSAQAPCLFPTLSAHC
ncbi:hypothetical protein PO909_014212 [Leuciscus waleckii]